MSTSNYNLVLPQSVEPAGCWTPNSLIVFEMDHQGHQIRAGTVRFNGVLQLFKGNTPIVRTDFVSLNPNAGINGMILQTSVRFGASSVETINQYGRFCAMENEAKYYQMEHGTQTNAMLELMAYSNNGDVSLADTKCRIASGLLFPINGGNPSEIPFSVDLNCCVNKSEVSLPYSRTGKITIELLLQSANDCGIISNINPSVETFTYKLRNLEMRYMTDLEEKAEGAIILQCVHLSHTPSIINKLNSLSFSPPSSFDSVVCSLINITHSGTANNSFTHDTLASEALIEQIQYLEFKVNGQDDTLTFPLQKQTSEILYNALLAFNPMMRAYDTTSIQQHGLTYNKLNQTVKTGYMLGCRFHGGVDAGSKVAMNIALASPPANPYTVYIYTIGRLII
jgi:hypothetical protein